jgi:hypothetical protein
MMHLLSSCIITTVAALCLANGLDLSDLPSTGSVSFDVQIGWGPPTSSSILHATVTHTSTTRATKTSSRTLLREGPSPTSAEDRTTSDPSQAQVSGNAATWDWRHEVPTSTGWPPDPRLTASTELEHWHDGETVSSTVETPVGPSATETRCGGHPPWNGSTGYLPLPASSGLFPQTWNNSSGGYLPTGFTPPSSYPSSPGMPYSGASRGAASRTRLVLFIILCVSLAPAFKIT